VNRVVYENVRRRMRHDDYVTLMVARHVAGGRFIAAGAHQPMFVVRGGGEVEVIEPAGPWVGVMPKLPAQLGEYEIALAPGDSLCLITDGIVEARNGEQELFGEERLTRILARERRPAADTLQDIFASVEAFTAEIALARSITHPHVARLIEVRESEGEWLLFSQYVAAGTLAALLERRGPLSVGELVTLISPLAQGLAAMHRAGLVHGHLDLCDVMFDADGRPVITDAGLRLQEYPGTPLADLSALGTIARHAGGSPALFPDTLFTGDGDQLSRRVLQLAAPLPIDLGQTSGEPSPFGNADGHTSTPSLPADRTGVSPPTPDEPNFTPSVSPTSVDHPSIDHAAHRAPTGLRRAPGARRAGRLPAGKRSTGGVRRARQRRLAYGVLGGSGLVAAVALVVGLVGVLGKPATGSTVAANEPRPSTSPGGEQVSRDKDVWLRTLHGLDARRARAFSTLDQRELDKVYVPGSAPWTADRSLLTSYQRQRIRVDGLRVRIESLMIERAGTDTVVLRIVDRLVAGAAITATGQRTPLPQGSPTARRLTLKAGNATWRISAITAA
jgi:serine/threonine protein kinase